MRIAFYCSNKHLPEIDFSDPYSGNPGCGAAEYLHVLIPFMLNKFYYESFELIILADKIDNMPANMKSHKVNEGIIEAASLAKKLLCDIFVFRPRMNEEKNILSHLENLKLKSIGRAALTPTYDHLIKMSKCKFFKALVCVGENQFNYLIDSPVSNKIININNVISDKLIKNNFEDFNLEDRKDIVYMGSLVPQKNFHYLASVWKDISLKIPEANLHVIGSSKTYGIKKNLGKFGLAEENYEDLFMSLLNSNKESAKKVIFHGNLSNDKYMILNKSRVGIVNPLGTTETCCVSAVEMQAMGLPVCTGNYEGLKTTIINYKSGLLSRNKRDFKTNILSVYKNKNLFNNLSKGAILNAKINFSTSHNIHKWYSLFFKVGHNINFESISLKSFFEVKSFFYGLILINRIFCHQFLGIKGFSLLQIENLINKIKFFLKKILKNYLK